MGIAIYCANGFKSPFYTHVTGADSSIKHLYDYFHDVVQLNRYIIRKIICIHLNQG